MDDWLHEHLTQILLCYVGEVRVRWWGKDLSQLSFAAGRHSSYLEMKWTAGMGSSSSSCTYYSSDMCLRVFMILRASPKRVLKLPWITGKISFGESHNFFLDFQWGLCAHWSPVPQKRWRSFPAGAARAGAASPLWTAQLKVCSSSSSPTNPPSAPPRITHPSPAPSLCSAAAFCGTGTKFHLLPVWPGKWNAKYKMLPLPASQAGWGCHAGTSRNTHFVCWKLGLQLGHRDNVWHCGRGSGAAQRENKTLSGDTEIVPHDFRGWWCYWVFCSFLLLLGFHVSDVLPRAGGPLQRHFKSWTETLIKPLNMLSWHPKMSFRPFHSNRNHACYHLISYPSTKEV